MDNQELREKIANTLFEYRAANLLVKEARYNIADEILNLIPKQCEPASKKEKAMWTKEEIWEHLKLNLNLPDSITETERIERTKKFIPEAERLINDTAHDELWKQGWNACRKLCDANLVSRVGGLESELLALHKIFDDYKESRISFGKCRELLVRAITNKLLGG